MYLNGQKLKELRKTAHLSRWKLSLECKVSPKTIQNIESCDCEHGVTLETTSRLASFFNIKVEDLIHK
jgi:DNA-binding XRE family transcriptional regulator